MKTTTKIFLNAVSSRFWPEVILATLISLFSVLSLLFHIWRDFIQKVIREGVSFYLLYMGFFKSRMVSFNTLIFTDCNSYVFILL